MSLHVLALLALVGCGAGFVDAIAGGGGLLTLPSLALAGLDPVAAVATNKLASHGALGAGRVRWRGARRACTALGAARIPEPGPAGRSRRRGALLRFRAGFDRDATPCMLVACPLRRDFGTRDRLLRRRVWTRGRILLYDRLRRSHRVWPHPGDGWRAVRQFRQQHRLACRLRAIRAH